MKDARWAIGLAVVGLVMLGLSFVVRPGMGAAAPESPPPTAAPTLTLADQGRVLFRAKACASCHLQIHSGAPNLANYEADPEFLRTWLKDPAAVRPQTVMPNLGLKEWEIEALIAFLETGGVASLK